MKRKALKAIRATLLLLPILTLLCSCEDVAEDNYRYPSVRTDFACIATDGKGRIKHLLLDDGSCYPVRLTQDFLEAYDDEPTYKRDTLYRLLSVYELVSTAQNDTVADLYALGSIISQVPTPLRDDEELHQNPVYLQSIWLSGGYLNFVLEVKALNGKHSIGFVDTTPEGMQGKEFTFYHRVVDDVESYRQKLYGSIPLVPFKESLGQGDTLRFVVNTYDKGNRKIDFPM
ncbi:MAG: hypothetical protein E7091_04090 [Bacteroidales bacterium]|nr:hypothetical protein [Bacteroidales bacterium]